MLSCVEYAEGMGVLIEWKSLHSAPLIEASKQLNSVVIKIDDQATLASRLKRARFIVDKLKREPSMALDKMQDIGGCRAILRTEKDVRKAAKALRRKKHIKTAHNYLKSPKEDGYRGFHLTGRYFSQHVAGLYIEFQIRTRIQHAWATAGEITELFTDKSIKNLVGDSEWNGFYNDLADIFSVIDTKITRRYIDLAIEPAKIIAPILKTLLNSQQKKTVQNIKRKQQKLNVMEKFQAYSNSLVFAEKQRTNELLNGYFLIHVIGIKTTTPQIKLRHYNEIALQQAQTKTYELEKRIADSDQELVVLVSSTAVGGIQESYPNYFADSLLFTRLVTARLSI